MAPVPFPEGCRCAVLLGFDFDGTSHEVGRGIAPLGINSWGRYPGKRGIARHMDLLEKHGVPATFFVPGYDAEQYPAVVKDIDRRGFEVAAHGYLHEAWALEGDASCRTFLGSRCAAGARLRAARARTPWAC
jgi:hypothetical protein